MRRLSAHFGVLLPGARGLQCGRSALPQHERDENHAVRVGGLQRDQRRRQCDRHLRAARRCGRRRISDARGAHVFGHCDNRVLLSGAQRGPVPRARHFPLGRRHALAHPEGRGAERRGERPVPAHQGRAQQHHGAVRHRADRGQRHRAEHLVAGGARRCGDGPGVRHGHRPVHGRGGQRGGGVLYAEADA